MIHRSQIIHCLDILGYKPVAGHNNMFVTFTREYIQYTIDLRMEEGYIVTSGMKRNKAISISRLFEILSEFNANTKFAYACYDDVTDSAVLSTSQICSSVEEFRSHIQASLDQIENRLPELKERLENEILPF